MFIREVALFLFPPEPYKKLLGFTFKAVLLGQIVPWPAGVMKPDEKQGCKRARCSGEHRSGRKNQHDIL